MVNRIKTLPVYPEFPPSFWSFKYAVSMLGRKASMPPLGLVTAAAMFPEDRFDFQKVADLNARKLTDRQIKNCDLVMITSMQIQSASQEEVIDRAHFFGKPVLCGGPYTTSNPERVNADYLVLGEAELSLPAFLEDFLRGNARRVYDEESARRQPLLVQLTKEGKPLIDRTPIPRWDLLNLRDYASLPVQYSRGCPYDCEFCDITHLYGRVPRTKTPEQMVREFDALHHAGWRGSTFIVDDNFIGNRKNVRQLLPAITKWQEQHHYAFSLFTEASMDLALPVNRDILEGMVQAGFDQVFLGIESVDPDVLRGMNKSQNVAHLTPQDKIRVIQGAGLKAMGGFIIGSDGEKPEVFDNMFRFIQETGIVIPMVGLLGALKGTRLYERMEKEGRLRSDPSGNNTHDLTFNFKPELDEQFLLKGYTELLRRLFDPKNYYERCRIQDSRLGPHKSDKRFNPSGIRAFFNIAYENLYKHPDREFVRYVLETLLTKPRHFAEAITNTVKRHHFETITDATVSVGEYRERLDELYERLAGKVKGLRGSLEQKYAQFKSMQVDIEKEAARRYNKIHEDFRDTATQYLNDLRSRIGGLGESYFAR